MTNKKFIENFYAFGQDGKNGHLIVKNGIMYSYGYHYPLIKKHGNIYIINSTLYSSTTSRHQHMARYLCPTQHIEAPDCDIQKAADYYQGERARLENLKDKARNDHIKNIYENMANTCTAKLLIIQNL